jgi:nitrite reductase/ring-hydroxylating ferredoxin subunit/uncharacterized membrane protein
MASEVAIDLVERQDWLEPVADKVASAVSSAYEACGPVGTKVANFLHGTWLGHPLHSVLTDVPIGSWTAALVLDALDEISGREEFGRAADTAVTVGLVGAVGSAVTGLTDWRHTDGKARRVGMMHAMLNTSAALLYTTSLVLRRRDERRAGRGFALLGYAISSAAAYLGGHLVYEQMIGVDHTADKRPPSQFVPVLAESELGENMPRRVEADGMPVLLVRRGSRIYAMAETCSHMGGPLAEGRLEDDCVRCPWHSSLFALEDGRVIEGPSVHPQPDLETRIRGGQIEVRARQ